MSQAAQLAQGLGPEKHEKTLNYLSPPTPDVRPLVARSVGGLGVGWILFTAQKTSARERQRLTPQQFAIFSEVHQWALEV